MPGKDAAATGEPAPAKGKARRVPPARATPDKDAATSEDAPGKDATSEDAPGKVAPGKDAPGKDAPAKDAGPVIAVRRIHRRDLNRVWEFLKLCFRDVNRETVEYQRPRSKRRFLEVYEEEGVEQLIFEVKAPPGRRRAPDAIVGYAECAFEISGTDNWMNERYFSKREMRPLFVEELAVSPDYQGQGIGGFCLEQLEHLARVRGCTHMVLEVAENNTGALHFYRGRNFYKLDAAIFLAKKVTVEAELLPPRRLKRKKPDGDAAGNANTRSPVRTSRR